MINFDGLDAEGLEALVRGCPLPPDVPLADDLSHENVWRWLAWLAAAQAALAGWEPWEELKRELVNDLGLDVDMH